MARTSGQAPFGIFEITPVGLVVALVGGLYLLLFSGTLLEHTSDRPDPKLFQTERHHVSHLDIAGDALGDTSDFAEERPLRIWRALASLGVFAGVVALAALNVAPIADRKSTRLNSSH